MRVGIKCLGLFFESQNVLSRNQPFLEKINTKSCYNIQKMLMTSQEMGLWEAARIAMGLSQFEYNKMNDIFDNMQEIDLLFSNEISQHLGKNIKKIDNLQLRKELLNVFFSKIHN